MGDARVPPALRTLSTAYPALAPRFRTWVLTTIASGVMTLSTLPFVVDYATRGGVAGVQMRADAVVAVNRFFRAHLCADMIVVGRSDRLPDGVGPPRRVHRHRADRDTVCYYGAPNLPPRRLHPPPPPPLQHPLRPHPPRHAHPLPHRAALLLDVPALSTSLSTSPSSSTSPSLSVDYAKASVPRFPAVLLALVSPLHAMWFKGWVAAFVCRYRQGKAEVVETSEVDGGTHPHPLTRNVYPDGRSRPIASIPPVSLTPYALAGVGVGVSPRRFCAISSSSSRTYSRTRRASGGWRGR